MKYPRKALTVCAGLLAATASFGQPEGDFDYATATITEEFCVSLDTEVEVSEYYEIDISHLALESEIEAKNKFGYIDNNLLTYSVDFAAEKAYLHIHLDRTAEPKDIVWWSAYIESLCGL